MGVSQCPYFFELVEKISNGEPIQNISREFRVLIRIIYFDAKIFIRIFLMNFKFGQDQK